MMTSWAERKLLLIFRKILNLGDLFNFPSLQFTHFKGDLLNRNRLIWGEFIVSTKIESLPEPITRSVHLPY